MIALMWRDRRSGFESSQVLDVPGEHPDAEEDLARFDCSR